MRKMIGFIPVVLLIAYFFAYIFILDAPVRTTLIDVECNAEEKVKEPYYKAREDELLAFIKEHMLGINGEIFTTVKPSADGIQTLSESVGLMMNYSVFREKKDLFDLEFSYLKKRLLVDNRYIKWLDGNLKTNCNAAIDDLRIVKALLRGYDRWKNEEYLKTAILIQQSIFEKQVIDGHLCEFYDWGQEKVRKRIPLCYYDFTALHKLENFNMDWGSVAEDGEKIVSGGTFRELPILFKKYYNYNTGKYSLDEEYSKGKGICLTYTICTALHMAEINKEPVKFTEWLKNEFKKGKLNSWYDPYTLKPVQKNESTAVYALAAVYSKKVEEDELYRRLLDKMLKFRVDNDKSTYYGGFGIEETGEFYSFDNLTALWALALANE